MKDGERKRFLKKAGESLYNFSRLPKNRKIFKIYKVKMRQDSIQYYIEVATSLLCKKCSKKVVNSEVLVISFSVRGIGSVLFSCVSVCVVAFSVRYFRLFVNMFRHFQIEKVFVDRKKEKSFLLSDQLHA